MVLGSPWWVWVAALLACPGCAQWRDVPGCFLQDARYLLTHLDHVTNPIQAVLDRLECQLLCKQTAGCGDFVYFAASKFCYLGRNHSGVVGTQGAVSGPSACAEDKPSACEDLPKEQFPAETSDESQSAWPMGFTPTNLQCWPTNMYWQPAFCRSIPPTSIENTSTAGHCQDLQKVHIPAETSCAASCAGNVLCSAWQVRKSEASLEECFQGVGKDCFGSAPEASIVDAGRFQHGVYRVLADLTGVELQGLSLMFGTASVPVVSQEQAVRRCANLCLSILACQAWQYSTSQGCYIQDPSQEMPYPPVIRKGTELAKTAVAGQYIQRVCPGEMSHLRGDQPKPKHPEHPEHPEPEAPKVVVVDAADAATPQMQSPEGEVEDAVIRTVQATTQRPHAETAVPAGVNVLTTPATPVVPVSAILPVNSTPGIPLSRTGVAEANSTALPIPVVTAPPSLVSTAPVVAVPAVVSTAPTAASPTAQPIAALPAAPTGEPVLVVAKNGRSEARYRESGLSGQGNMLVSEPAQQHLEHHAEWPFVIFGILGLILVCAGAHALRVYSNKKANYYCLDPEESDDSLLHG